MTINEQRNRQIRQQVDRQQNALLMDLRKRLEVIEQHLGISEEPEPPEWLYTIPLSGGKHKVIGTSETEDRR